MNDKMPPPTQAQKTMPRGAAPLGGVTRPKVGNDRCQTIITVCDTSGSMAGPKIDALNLALGALARGLQDPKSRDAFSIGHVAYGTHAEVRLEARKATAVNPADLALTSGMVGPYTNITDGLDKALAMVREITKKGEQQRPIVLLMTDGFHYAPGGSAPERVAAELKKSADLVCVGFGADANMSRLQQLANSPGHAVLCSDDMDLRRFFIKVATTMTSATRLGQDAAALLGQSKVLRG